MKTIIIINEDNNNLSIRSINSINSKNKSKDNNNSHKTIVFSKTRNKQIEKKEKQLPSIKV